MPTLKTPFFSRSAQSLRQACGSGALAIVLAAVLAGCASTSAPQQYQDPAYPSSDVDAERLRLAQTRVQLGAMHFAEGRYDIALGEVAQALQVHPSYADAYNLQGWIYLSQRDYTKADASFDRALNLRPGDPDTRYNQGWSQCQQKHFENAHLHFDAALADVRFADAGRARTLLAKGVCLREEGKTDQVLPVLTQAYELDPDSPSITLDYARALMDSGDMQRARFYARRLNNSEFANAASLWLGIRIDQKLGDALAVRQQGDQLRQRFPSSRERDLYEQGAWND